MTAVSMLKSLAVMYAVFILCNYMYITADMYKKLLSISVRKLSLSVSNLLQESH